MLVRRLGGAELDKLQKGCEPYGPDTRLEKV